MWAEEAAPPPDTRAILKARLAEAGGDRAHGTATAPDAASKGRPSAVSANTAAPAENGDAEINPLLAPTAKPAAPEPASTGKHRAPAEAPTVLPQVEVKKRRISELDQMLAKQERDIAREKKNTKPGELDKALNDSKIARPLAVFGGESTQFRQRVASERVSLMQDEKDLIEAMAQAKTKEEKAELQKQLDFLRAERRELERALR